MNKKGFSLLEVLIAVAILAGMSLVIYTTMNRALSAKVKVEGRDAVIQGIRLGMEKMTGDLSQAFTANAAFKGKNSIYETGLKGDEESLHFSTMSHFHYMTDARDTDSVTVGYLLKRNDQGLSNLMRRESQRLSEKLDKDGSLYPLIENVKELKFSYYDSNKKEWVIQWDSSRLSVLGRLPQAVKIEITVVKPDEEEGRGRGQEFVFTTLAPVEMYQNEINF